MLNTLQVPGAQVARGNSAALSVLADRIRAEHAAVVSAFSSAIQHALAAGRALIEAKDLAGHGRWGKFLRDCDVNERTARRYMQLAELAANRSSTTDLVGLSIEGAIKRLSPPKSSDRSRQRRNQTCPTPAQEKLSSLAWADASPAERARFVSTIGWLSLAEAVPADWLPVIRGWLHVCFSNETATTIDQDGNILADDLSIPTFLRRDRSTNSEVVS